MGMLSIMRIASRKQTINLSSKGGKGKGRKSWKECVIEDMRFVGLQRRHARPGVLVKVDMGTI
jgi:hypothetical protein